MLLYGNRLILNTSDSYNQGLEVYSVAQSAVEPTYLGSINTPQSTSLVNYNGIVLSGSYDQVN